MFNTQHARHQCVMVSHEAYSWLPASVVRVTETQYAPTGTVCRGSTHVSAGRFHVCIPRVHALRLISRAGKEGSTVSSIICDRDAK